MMRPTPDRSSGKPVENNDFGLRPGRRQGRAHQSSRAVAGWIFTLAFLLSAAPAPAATRQVLPGGTVVAIETNTASRIFAVHVLVRNRAAREPAGKAGLADLAHRMLTGGAAGMNRAELALALDSIGAQVKTVDSPFIPFDDYYTVEEYSYLRFQTIDTFYKKGLELLAAMLFQPSLTAENLAEARKSLGEVRLRNEKDPRGVGQRAMFQTLFPGGWKGRPINGTAESGAAITLDDVQSFWPQYFQPANLVVTVTTNLPEAQVLNALRAALGNRPAAPPTVRADLSAPSREPAAGPQTVKLGGRQSYVLAGRAFPVKKADQPALEVLAAMFSDDLAFELREKRGLAYSLGAGIQWLNDGRLAALLISMGTRPENLSAANDGIREQLAVFEKKQLSPRQLEITVNRMKGQALMRWIPSLSRAYFMGVSLFRGDGANAYRERVECLKRVKPGDLERVRKNYFLPDRFHWVSVE